MVVGEVAFMILEGRSRDVEMNDWHRMARAFGWLVLVSCVVTSAVASL